MGRIRAMRSWAPEEHTKIWSFCISVLQRINDMMRLRRFFYGHIIIPCLMRSGNCIRMFANGAIIVHWDNTLYSGHYSTSILTRTPTEFNKCIPHSRHSQSNKLFSTLKLYNLITLPIRCVGYNNTAVGVVTVLFWYIFIKFSASLQTRRAMPSCKKICYLKLPPDLHKSNLHANERRVSETVLWFETLWQYIFLQKKHEHAKRSETSTREGRPDIKYNRCVMFCKSIIYMLIPWQFAAPPIMLHWRGAALMPLHILSLVPGFTVWVYPYIEFVNRSVNNLSNSEYC